MFIEKRPNGKYRAGMYYDDPMTGKRRKVSITIDSDTKAARKVAYDALRDKIAELSYVKKDEEITLKEIAEKYAEHQKASTKAGTYRRDKIMIWKVVDTLGEDVLANKLTARYVDQKLRATGKENVGLNTYLNQFKRMMRWAYRMEYVDDIAFLDRLPAYPDPEKKLRIEEKFLSSDELKKLLEGMTVTKWKLLTQFLALSGLRIGEAMGLVVSCLVLLFVAKKLYQPLEEADRKRRDAEALKQLAAVTKRPLEEALARYDRDLVRKALSWDRVTDYIRGHGTDRAVVSLIDGVLSKG